MLGNKSSSLFVSAVMDVVRALGLYSMVVTYEAPESTQVKDRTYL